MSSEFSDSIFCKNCKLDFTLEFFKGTMPKNCPRCGAGLFEHMKYSNSSIPNTKSPMYDKPNDVVDINAGRPLNNPGKKFIWGVPMLLYQIIEEYLKENNYDGLYNSDTECACTLEDLFHCETPCTDCEAGYISECDCGDHEYHIGPKWE